MRAHADKRRAPAFGSPGGRVGDDFSGREGELRAGGDPAKVPRRTGGA
jgi:hypothetical protein